MCSSNAGAHPFHWLFINLQRAAAPLSAVLSSSLPPELQDSCGKGDARSSNFLQKQQNSGSAPGRAILGARAAAWAGYTVERTVFAPENS